MEEEINKLFNEYKNADIEFIKYNKELEEKYASGDIITFEMGKKIKQLKLKSQNAYLNYFNVLSASKVLKLK